VTREVVLSKLLTRPRASPRPLLAGVVWGLIGALVLTLPKLLFIDEIGEPTPFLLYFAAIMLAAYQGGLYAGLLTTLLCSGLSVAFFIGGAHSPLESRVLMMLIVFGIEGVAISLLTDRFVSERLRSNATLAKLRSTRDKLDLVLSGTDEGITLQDGRGKLVYANRLAAELTGCRSPRELLRLPPAELRERFQIFDAEGKPFPFDRLPGRVLLEGGAPREVLVRFRVRGGSEDRWSLIRANAVRDGHGAVRFVVNVFRDVTEERRQQEALGLAQEWFQIALRSIGDALITTDAEGRVNLLNPVAEALTGWSSEDAVRRPLEEVFPIVNEDTRNRVQSPVEQVLRDGVVVGLANHTLLIRRDGSEIAIDDSAAPIVDGNGKLTGVILVFRDVTEKRALERRRAFLVSATRELSSSLDYKATLGTVARLAVPSIADWCAVDILEEGKLERLAVAHVDPTKVEWVKHVRQRYPSDPDAPRGVHRILKTGEAEMIATLSSELVESAAQDAEHLEILKELGLRSYLGVPLAHEGTTFGVITMVMAESGRRYTKDDLELAKSLADRAALAVTNARLYQRAARAHDEAVLASRTKDEFLAMLGHELRNPLAPIQTALDLMRLRSGGRVATEHQVIERQVKHLVRLVDDLLDVSRIAHNRVELERKRVDLKDVVERALELAWPPNSGRAHTLHVELSADLVVLGDAIRLAQIVANLLSNSIKYTPAGGSIWVETRREGEDARISVRDDGQGIGPDTLARVFDMFVQEPQALDRARGGLGLGLAIVRSLVLAHGGIVTAHSDGPGRGSEFVIRLPLSLERPATIPPRPPSTPPRAAERVLVVDDNHDARELLARLLGFLGHSTWTADNGLDALAIAAAHHPTLALLDIGLPGMDGYEVAKRLKSLHGLGHLKLVAVTGYGQSVDRARSWDAGFSAHIVKPLSLEKLTDLVGTSGEDGVQTQA